MAQCGCSRRCTCSVIAGAGVTVDGNGSPSNPYVVSSTGGGSGAVVVTSGTCVGLTGDGTPGAPITPNLILDPDPANTAVCGPGGLLVTPAGVDCDDVRPCISAGPGASYDVTAGVVSARLSTDAGNTLAFGSDGGLHAEDTPTVVTAGANVTVTGAGSTGDPYVVSSAGGGGVATVVEAGDRVTVTGTGVPADPYVVAADRPTCDDVRPCLSAGPGIDYDTATGVISAEDTVVTAGTGVTITGAGSTADPYVVAADEATVTAACGLTGDGSAATPLQVAHPAWPYACPPETYGGAIACGADGLLRGEPRGHAHYVSNQQVLDFPDNPLVPAPQDTEVATHQLAITNPDPCRAAFVMIEAEVDADFNLPANGGSAGLGISTDETWYLRNTGSAAMLDVHGQATKVISPAAGTWLAAGATDTYTVSIRMGRGAGGATYNRLQSFARAFVFVM